MTSAPRNGFSLIELLVALAVVAILLGIGVPSLLETVRDSRARAEYNRLVFSLFLARSESAMRAQPVTLCPRRSDTECGTSWSDGWLVFVDAPPLSGGATPSLGGEDIVIGIEGALADEDSVLRAYGSASGMATEASELRQLTYRSSGGTTLMNASFLLCDERGAERSRVANVVITGDVRPGRPSGTETIPRDVFGRSIDCPVASS